jgi:predicted regulator of Ras-like GTPase activity (Roadblock/LC7/MglB family)
VGEALGGPAALPWAQRTAEACREWVESRHGMPLETAVFVGTLGRIVARPAGAGLLVAFAENDASAGLLRVRLREIAEQVTGDGTAAPQLQPLP